jgi:hypothetical protein
MKSIFTLMIIFVAAGLIVLTSCSGRCGSTPNSGDDTKVVYSDWNDITSNRTSDAALYANSCKHCDTQILIVASYAQTNAEGDGHIFIRGNASPEMLEKK